MLIFETERLVVRQYNENDKDNFFLLSGDEMVMQYIRPASTKEESDKFLLENISFYHDNPRRGRWGVEEKSTGEFVGSFAIIPVPWDKTQVQLGYSLIPGNWGKGFATELTKAGLDYFFSHDPFGEIYGVTEMPNIASQKVLLKAGFELYGNKMEGEKELMIFVARNSAI